MISDGSLEKSRCLPRDDAPPPQILDPPMVSLESRGSCSLLRAVHTVGWCSVRISPESQERSIIANLVLNIGLVSNETNTDVHMYIEEFILVEIWIHCCTKLKSLNWKVHWLLYNRNKGREMRKLLLDDN